MIHVFLYFLISAGIIVVSNGLGNFVNRIFKLGLKWSLSFVGFSVLMGIIFIVSFPFIQLGTSSQLYHWALLLVFVLAMVLAIPNIKIKFSSIETIIIVVLFVLYTILSIHQTLGESMSDSLFIFNVIIRNINTDVLNNFDMNTGYIFQEASILPTKSYITYYLFYSSLNYFVNMLYTFFPFKALPAYVLTTWVSNFMFYFFSGELLINLLRKTKAKLPATIVIVSWIGLYLGTFYYNIVFPHIGLTYLTSLAIPTYILLMMEYEHSKLSKRFNIPLLIIGYSLVCYATTGVFYQLVFMISLIVMTLMGSRKNYKILTAILMIPIVHYLGIMLPSRWLLIILGYAALIVILIVITHFKLDYLVKRYLKYIVGALFVGIAVMSFVMAEGYFSELAGFFEPIYRGDRIIDYFSFFTLERWIINILAYVVIIAYMVKHPKSIVTKLILLTLLLFINPLVKPFVSRVLMHPVVYNRSFFIVFNSATLALGVNELMEYIGDIDWIQYASAGFMTLILIIFTVPQVFGYYYPSHKPQEEDYNAIYKISDRQVEVLEYLKDIVDEEKLVNPKIVSQIFATGYYHERFYVPGYHVYQQRNGPTYEMHEDLYKMFYTPAIPGDDGPRLDAPNYKSCEIIPENGIEFVVYDKNMIVYERSFDNYVPTYWYARTCAENLFENDRYILYRFNLGND